MDLESRSRLSLKSPNLLIVTDGVMAQVAIYCCLLDGCAFYLSDPLVRNFVSLIFQGRN